jgi:hypothetical protein
MRGSDDFIQSRIDQMIDLLIFPKVMSFQNIPALGLPEKGHYQDW